MNKIFAFFLVLATSIPAFAQNETTLTTTKSEDLALSSTEIKKTSAADPIVVAEPTATDTVSAKKEVKNKAIELSLMPYIGYNRTMGGMFGAIPMMMYRVSKNDTISPKSMAMASVAWTTNDSWFSSFINRTYFGQGDWRSFFVLLNGKKNASTAFNSTPEGGNAFEADFSNRMIFVMGSLQYQIIPKLFVGASGSFSNTKTNYSEEAQQGYDSDGNPIKNNEIDIVSLSLVGSYDTRNDQYYPTAGINARVIWISNPEFMNDFTANRIRTEYNTYFSKRGGKDVFAARYSGQFGLGDVMFQQQKTIGGKDLRGYTSGKYRGDGVIDVQAEYRYNPFDKVGFVGFAGVATLYGSTIEDYNWKLYPGAGVGIRYRAFKQTKMNIGLDAAVGKEDWGIYFRVSEAF